jgi:uncharacterized membrane protein YphA (DoxX/SURF4 family)
MYIAYVVVAILLSFALVFSGRSKLVKDADVTATMTKIGVPLSWFQPLALVEFVGAAGLLIGIFYRPLGIAAGIGVALYFVGAVITHARANDIKGSPAAAVLFLVGAASAALGFASM